MYIQSSVNRCVRAFFSLWFVRASFAFSPFRQTSFTSCLSRCGVVASLAGPFGVCSIFYAYFNFGKKYADARQVMIGWRRETSAGEVCMQETTMCGDGDGSVMRFHCTLMLVLSRSLLARGVPLARVASSTAARLSSESFSFCCLLFLSHTRLHILVSFSIQSS